LHHWVAIIVRHHILVNRIHLRNLQRHLLHLNNGLNLILLIHALQGAIAHALR
jgi:hypothetical protein